MNIRLPFGIFTPVFSGPQLHRIHHSCSPEHIDKNFAAFLPIFDVVFGTYYKPRRDEFPATGLADGENLNGFVRASVAPFRYWWTKFRKPVVAAPKQL